MARGSQRRTARRASVAVAVAGTLASGVVVSADAATTQKQQPWVCHGAGKYACVAFDYKHDPAAHPSGGHRWMSPFIYAGCNATFDRFNPKYRIGGAHEQYYQNTNTGAWVKYYTTPNSSVTITGKRCYAYASAPSGDVGWVYGSPIGKKTTGITPLRVRSYVAQYCNGDSACGGGGAGQTYVVTNTLQGV